MMPRLKPNTTSANRIYEELRHSIIVGHYKPGERLYVNRLTKHYGTSVTPVREALRMLSQEGLVTIKPHAGFYVIRVTFKDLRDMLELREILEIAAIERAAVRITDEQLEQLEHVHAGYTGDSEESRVRYITENRRFHYLIAQASGNQKLAEMLGRLHDRLVRFFITVHTGEEMERIHACIIEALRTRDVAVARQAMLDEVNKTREITLRHMIEEEGDTWHLTT